MQKVVKEIKQTNDCSLENNDKLVEKIKLIEKQIKSMESH